MQKPSEPKAPFSAQMATEEYASKPTSATGSEPVSTNVKAKENANHSEASASLKEAEPNNASMTAAGAVKPDFQTSKAGVGLQKHSTGALAHGSGLVRMTLRTIEYPDGHRERLLLPIKHAQRVTLETEDQWYNPLGLR
jgi:hypothetical protein